MFQGCLWDHHLWVLVGHLLLSFFLSFFLSKIWGLTPMLLFAELGGELAA